MRISWAIVVAACLAGCGKPVPDTALVARVNGEAITKAQFEAEAARDVERQLRGRESPPPGIAQRIRETVLRRMIDDAIVAQKATALGIAVTAEELDARYREYAARFPTEEALRDHLDRTRNTADSTKADLRRNLMRDRIADRLGGAVEVTDPEVAHFYEQNRARFTQKERVKASRIVVRVADKSSPAEKAQARSQARNLRAKANVRATDFTELARSASQGPEAARGGELGWIERGVMAGEFDGAVFPLAAGAVSPVIETRLGYEIVKVWEKAPRRERALADARDEIRAELEEGKRTERRREALSELRKQATVEQLFLL
jgi:parvulin-like peptidyl-prolyl isomerase